MKLLFALAVLAVCPAAGFSQSARPEAPSAWAEAVPVAEAKAGNISDIVSTVAQTTDKGVSDEIATNREKIGSSPTPPGKD